MTVENPEFSEIELTAAAKSLLSSHEKSSDVYRQIVSIIHQSQPNPKLARSVLLNAGMGKSRISELLRISYGSDEMVARYVSRMIGFRPALESTRNPRTIEQRVCSVLNTLDLIAKGFLPAGDSKNIEFRGETFSAKIKIASRKVEIERL